MIFWSTWGILPRSGLYFPPNCFRNFNWGIRCASSCDPTHAAGSNDCILALCFFDQPEAFCPEAVYIFHPIAFAISIEASAAAIPVSQTAQQQPMPASWLHDALNSLSFSAHQKLFFPANCSHKFHLRHQPQELMWARLPSSPCQPHLGYFLAWLSSALPIKGPFSTQLLTSVLCNLSSGINCKSSFEPACAAGCCCSCTLDFRFCQ